MRSVLRFVPTFLSLMAAVNAIAGAENWVEESNRHSQSVIAVLAAFEPERASELGASGYDEAIIDLGPDLFVRYQSAMRKLIAALESEGLRASDPRIALDIQILLDYAGLELQKATLKHDLLLPYYSVAEIVYDGLSGLLRDGATAANHAAALQRLRRYTGLVGGAASVAELAKGQSRARFKEQLLGPYRGAVEKDLEDSSTFLTGIEELFAATAIEGWREPYNLLASQVRAYDDWVRQEILPRTRADHRLPGNLYAAALRDRGVKAAPEQLIEEGLRAFIETRNQMAAIAPLVADRNGYDTDDYLQVIRRLKERQLTGERLLAFYRKALADLEDVIRRENLVTLPERDAGIRLASAAETAREPAPHITHPRLIGTECVAPCDRPREYPLFVLPYLERRPDGSWPATDDTFEANAWTLTAHELRPGHELQFSTMIDGGTSIARAVFAWNSANIEGWGLYAEAIVRPYLPLDGQLISLQWKLLRAARMFLDPMLNSGMVGPDAAKAFLVGQVGIEDSRAQSEVERYMYRMPGQATAYYYGYARLLEIRAQAELRLGKKFDAMKFHDFILAQGLMPATVLGEAVQRDFVDRTLSQD